ncbi:Sphingomyelin phosphodiesterase [Entamoeba marina]
MNSPYSNNCNLDNSFYEKKLISFIGDLGVGKTSIVNQYVENAYDVDYKPTIGANYLSKTLYFLENHIRLQIWDCAGKDAYQELEKSYLVNSDIVVVVFDDPISFTRAKEKYEEAKKIIRKTCKIYFVLNKVDKEINVDLIDSANEFVVKHQIQLKKCSAKLNQGVTALFEDILTDSFQQQHQQKGFHKLIHKKEVFDNVCDVDPKKMSSSNCLFNHCLFCKY